LFLQQNIFHHRIIRKLLTHLHTYTLTHLHTYNQYDTFGLEPIGRDWLFDDSIGTFNSAMFCLVPFKAMEVHAPRPMVPGRPAFLLPPPDFWFVILAIELVFLVPLKTMIIYYLNIFFQSNAIILFMYLWKQYRNIHVV